MNRNILENSADKRYYSFTIYLPTTNSLKNTNAPLILFAD